VEAENLIVFNL